MTDAQSQARVATEDATRFKRLATEAGSRIGDIDKLSSEATSRLAILQRDVKDAQTVIGEAAALRGQILQTRKERESAEREFADLQQRRMTLQGEVTRLQSQSTELAAKVNQQNMSISGLDQKYRELQEQLATAEVALQSARAEEVERRGSIKAISADLGRIKQETSELEPRQAALALATSQLATVQEQITSRQREAAAAAVQASQLNDQITHRQGELDLLNKTIAATMRQRDTLNAELPQLEKSKTALRAEIFDFEWRRRQLNSEVTQPPENLASQLKYWRWNGKE